MKQHKAEGDSRRRDLFWPFFWLTILVLLIVYLYAELMVGRLRTDAQGRLALAPHLVPQWDRVIEDVLARQGIRLNETARGEIDVLIETHIDQAFEPVYGQIPRLADVHYSVIGEYAELGAAATGKLADGIANTLFHQVGLEERLSAAMSNILAGSGDAIAGALTALNEDLESQLEFSPQEMQLLAPALELTLADMEARFSEVSLGLRGTGAAAGGAAGALAAKATGKKVAGKLIGKAALKAGAKAASIGGGAAVGAAAGSVVPGLGTALGGIVGAAVVWLATDKLIVEADEYLHREGFEAEMRGLVDAEKARIKADLRNGFETYLSRIEAHTRERLEGLRPVDIIGESTPADDLPPRSP